MTALRSLSKLRRRLLAAIALLVVAGVVLVVVLGAGSTSPGKPATGSKASGAATVQRRNLVQTDTEAGTLSYANPQTVYDRLSGTITWLPSVGHVIKPGGTLFRVNGQPVILMNGSTPAYRTLSAADTDGADVLELNRNLVALGFNANGITVDDVWQPGTTLGVELLQESLGETATGSFSLGRVVFLPGPQLVSTVQGTLGNADNGGGTQSAATTVTPSAPEFVSLTSSIATPTTSTTSTTTTSTTTTPTTTTPATTPPHHHHQPKHSGGQTPTLAALLALLKAQSAQLRAEAAQLAAAEHQNAHNNNNNSPSSGSHNPSSGNHNPSSGNHNNNGSNNNAAAGSSGTAVLQTSSTHLVVTVDLDASLQSEAKVGERVSVQLPAGNTVKGKVTAVSSVAQSSSNSSGNSGNGNGSGSGSGNGNGNGNGNGSGSSSTIPVTVTLSGRRLGAGLDQAAVSVNFAQARANNVLSVPVTALLAVGGGNYAVQEAAAPHTMIPVTVGLFAAGYVQVSGAGIHPGLQVTDSQG